MQWETTSSVPFLAQTVGLVGAPLHVSSTVSSLPKATCSYWLGSGPGTSAALRTTRCSGPGGSEVAPATTATQNTSTQAGTTMAPERGPRRPQAARAGMLQPPTPGSGAGGRTPLWRHARLRLSARFSRVSSVPVAGCPPVSLSVPHPHRPLE